MLLVFSSSITMLPQASTMAAAGVVSQQLAAVFAVPGTATIFHVLSRKARSWQNFWKSVSVDEGRSQERRKMRLRLKLEAEEKAIKHQQEVWHLRNGCPLCSWWYVRWLSPLLSCDMLRRSQQSLPVLTLHPWNDFVTKVVIVYVFTCRSITRN